MSIFSPTYKFFKQNIDLIKKGKVSVDVDTLSIKGIYESRNPFIIYHYEKASDIALALVDRLQELREENTKLRQTVIDQEKIIASLKSEIGGYLREKEVQ